jgi:penicillin V acylase-like amidase (Ntn superfamily)
MPLQLVIAKYKQVDVRREGERVQLLVDGREVLSGPHQPMLELARALYTQAKLAEAHAKAEQIILDQAILTRLGVPVGLTSDPAMLAEATKEAAWNSDLRRYIPPARAGGIASQAIFGTPTIIKHPLIRE